MQERVLFQGDHMRLAIKNEDADRVIFTFDNWARDRRFWDEDHAGVTFTNRGFAHVRLTTKLNDWYLNRDLPAVLDAATAIAGDYRARHGLAFSMGGYGLMLLSRRVAVDQALFFSPHTTYDTALPPHDTRYPPEVADGGYAAETYEAMRDGTPSKADCVIAYDPILPLDVVHARETARFFARPRMMELKDSGHPSASYIAKGLRWGQVVKAITSDRLRDILVMRAYAEVRAKFGPIKQSPIEDVVDLAE